MALWTITVEVATNLDVTVSRRTSASPARYFLRSSRANAGRCGNSYDPAGFSAQTYLVVANACGYTSFCSADRLNGRTSEYKDAHSSRFPKLTDIEMSGSS